MRNLKKWQPWLHFWPYHQYTDLFIIPIVIFHWSFMAQLKSHLLREVFQACLPFTKVPLTFFGPLVCSASINKALFSCLVYQLGSKLPQGIGWYLFLNAPQHLGPGFACKRWVINIHCIIHSSFQPRVARKPRFKSHSPVPSWVILEELLLHLSIK